MSRSLRIEYRGAVHHLMNRGSARRKVFLSRGDYGDFLKVGMCLMKRLSDMTLVEAAGEYGVRSCGAAGRACHGIRLKREADRRFRRRLTGPLGSTTSTGSSEILAL